MILIVSSMRDRTTQEVCRWLRYFRKDFRVLHEEDKLEVVKVTSESQEFRLKRSGDLIRLEEVSAYWYRRDDLNLVSDVRVQNPHLSHFVQQCAMQDQMTVYEFVHHSLMKKPELASFLTSNVNKLNVLELAKSAGLLIPDYLYTGTKKHVLKFQKEMGGLIFKTVSPGVHSHFEALDVSVLTQRLTPAILEELPEQFGNTFFQQEITKKYEIRSFYLDGTFYSLALISQLNDQTSVDYRNYDRSKPNRQVPYQLTPEIEEQLKQVIEQLGLKTCSVDLIKTPEGKTYFLEINPIGQFGNVSFQRNEYLEKKVAMYLSNAS